MLKSDRKWIKAIILDLFILGHNKRLRKILGLTSGYDKNIPITPPMPPMPPKPENLNISLN